MDENSVREALRELLLAEKTDLLLNLTAQGVSREIGTLTVTTLAAPSDYFYIGISVVNSREQVRGNLGRTAINVPSQAEYDVLIEVSDYGISQPGLEKYMFEKMDKDFNLFTDRIVNKLRSNYFITNSDNGSKYKLLEPERSVNKDNLSGQWPDAEGYHPLFYAQITFTLLEECTDSTKLYS